MFHIRISHRLDRDRRLEPCRSREGGFLFACDSEKRAALRRGVEAFEAEGCFFTSLEIARNQHAKSSELRTLVSLVRLHQQQGGRSESRIVLEQVYNWFTEGHELPDLIEAKQLLDSLAP